jgi:hypothetical protein
MKFILKFTFTYVTRCISINQNTKVVLGAQFKVLQICSGKGKRAPCDLPHSIVEKLAFKIVVFSQ